MNDNLLLDHVQFTISRPSFSLTRRSTKKEIILKLYALDERFGGELLVAKH